MFSLVRFLVCDVLPEVVKYLIQHVIKKRGGK